MQEKINRITYDLNDAIYCSAMLGGVGGEERKQDGLDSFVKEITDLAATGFSTEDSKVLLEKTICLGSKAFLAALIVCNDFAAFSSTLDLLEPKMRILKNPEAANKQRSAEFFSIIMSADTRKLPEVADFELYKEMRTEMLSQSNKSDSFVTRLFGQSKSPDSAVIHSVIKQFKDKFSADSTAESSISNSN
jgi:hypothetical protein